MCDNQSSNQSVSTVTNSVSTTAAAAIADVEFKEEVVGRVAYFAPLNRGEQERRQ